MLSSEEIETLIASKKREIEREKAMLGLVSPNCAHTVENDKEIQPDCQEQVSFEEHLDREDLGLVDKKETARNDSTENELEEIPAGLQRYIRRYIGLPVMLKAGEYSPNNPLIRGEHSSGGDAFRGLGEYERRRHTLRKIRQAQYREFLDRQAKKKQEEKEEAERQRREQEEKERQREERERQLLLEREAYSPERRRASVSCVVQNVHSSTVDSAVQVDGVAKPLSVAVQTDDADLFRSSPPWSLTPAERELSPRAAADQWGSRRRSYGDHDERTSVKKSNRDKLHSDLRHSYMPSIFDADAIQLRNMQAEKEAAERRQYYQQELKNQILEQQRIREERKSREKMLEQAEMRRLEEQLRMLRLAQEREVAGQRRTTANMEDNAKDFETKRTELQKDIEIETRKLRAATHPTRNLPKRTETSQSDSQKLPYFYPQSYQPVEKKPYSFNIPDNSIFNPNYDVDSYLRKNLNFKNKHGVDILNKNDMAEKLRDGRNDKSTADENDYIESIQFNRNEKTATDNKSKANEQFDTDYRFDMNESKKTMFRINDDKNQHTKNDHNTNRLKVSDPDIRQYKMDRTDFDPKQFVLRNDQLMNERVDLQTKSRMKERMNEDQQIINDRGDRQEIRKYIVEKALIHSPKERNAQDLSIPLLRHSPKAKSDTKETLSQLSEAMKKVEDKWKVPAVQKNILKSLPSEDGKNISILTQLGSIRRQLQLEQLKLDKMLSKND